MLRPKDFPKPGKFEFLLIDRDITVERATSLHKCSGCNEAILSGDWFLNIKKLNGGPVERKCQKCAKNTLAFEIHQLQQVLGKL